MPATKQTPRKRSLCPTCKTNIKWEEYLVHVKQCRKPAKPPKTIKCTICNSLFSKKDNLNKHVKKFHPVSATCTSASELDNEKSKSETMPSKQIQPDTDEWDKDPGIELDFSVSESSSSDETSDESNVETEKEVNNDEFIIGRMQRKPCTPNPVLTPAKRKPDLVSQPVPNKKPKVSLNEAGSVANEMKGIKTSVIDTADKEIQACSNLRCDSCGISFDDEIVHAIHRGWHSLRDPFRCNLCGKLYENRYSFYSHLGRAHTA